MIEDSIPIARSAGLPSDAAGFTGALDVGGAAAAVVVVVAVAGVEAAGGGCDGSDMAIWLNSQIARQTLVVDRALCPMNPTT